jgi:uncharacterized protein YxjI
MRYRLRQHLFSLANSYTVEDKDGGAAFEVDGKMMSVGSHFVFRDATGMDVAEIRQTRIMLTPTYEIYCGSTLAAVVESRLLNRLKPHTTFEVHVPGARDLVAIGDIWGFEYELRRGDRVLARVSKEGFTLTDTYDVHVASERDHVLALAVTVVIDAVCHPGRT